MSRTVVLALIVTAALGAGYWTGARHGAVQTTSTEPAPAAGKKLLYYRNPMGLADTSPVPKKDSMGMDYIPVYEGDAEPASTGELAISTEKVQKLGVRTEQAAMRELSRTVRASGTLAFDERRIRSVAPKFEGWIEELHVNTTGQPVSRGERLMEVYSPDLVTAQQEYLIAVKGLASVKDGAPEIQASMRALAAGALERLRNWDISDRELDALKLAGEPKRTITLRAPVSGVVVEKPALKGMRFMPGEALYQISDLSSLWVVADVAEQDLGMVRPGQTATIAVTAFPGRTFKGRVAFFYPTLAPETRTGKVRIELANPGGLLKPAMYASVDLAAGPSRKVLAVPASAVIDSGVRRIVLVRLAEGRFAPRDVTIGDRADDYVEITSGVKAGEEVVVAANFLIDAESNLKAVIGNMSSGNASNAPAASPASHRGVGVIESIDAASGKIRITHEPIATLNWPGMTMDFMLANPSLAGGLKPGAAVEFELVERKPGEYMITHLAARAATASGH
jgi:Cu(I)/Ag(I) efflux system membrane fusion protein